MSSPSRRNDFAGGALALLAAVHEHDALLGSGSENRLLLVNLDLDAHRLEPDEMLVRHSCAPATRATPAGRPPAGPDGRSRRRMPRARPSVIWLSSTLGLEDLGHAAQWSSVHIFFGSRFRCGCATMVLPSSRTKPMSLTTSAQFQP